MGVLVNAGGLHSNISFSSSGRGFTFCVFVGYLHGFYVCFIENVAIHVGFLVFIVFLLLFALVFFTVLRFCWLLAWVFHGKHACLCGFFAFCAFFLLFTFVF